MTKIKVCLCMLEVCVNWDQIVSSELTEWQIDVIKTYLLSVMQSQSGLYIWAVNINKQWNVNIQCFRTDLHEVLLQQAVDPRLRHLHRSHLVGDVAALDEHHLQLQRSEVTERSEVSERSEVTWAECHYSEHNTAEITEEETWCDQILQLLRTWFRNSF